MSKTPAAAAESQTDEIDRLIEGARDALTDDMVGRLSGTFAQALDLLERINRSRLDQALPAITQLVENGDLDRVVHLARVVGAADDSMNEEMVGRLAGTLAEGVDLLDRLNRSQLVDALPAITQLVNSGDLERIAHLARLLGAAEDALNDEMISRVAGVVSDGLCLVEQLTRNNALSQILTFLLRPEVQNFLVGFGEALVAANSEQQQMPPPKGGIGGWWQWLREPSNQRTMQFFGLFGKHLEAHRH